MAHNARLQGFGILVLCVLSYPAMTTAQQPAVNLMPLPASAQSGTGSLRVDSSFSVAFTGYTEPRLERARQRFLEQLRKQTGLLFLNKPGDSGKSALIVHTDRASKPVQELGDDESYSLEVTPSGAKLDAANHWGALRGLQTFLQLVGVSPDGFAAPSVTIMDQPRFPWR